MTSPELPCWVAGRPVHTGEHLEVQDRYSGELVARVARALPDTIQEGIAAAHAAVPAMARFRPWRRQAVLEHCVARFRERFDELAGMLCAEAGKPIRDARGEVTRLIDTFRAAAEESVRFNGEVMNLEISPRARGYTGMWRWAPVGACSFITPFNFPLNLAAHKVAPAIAAGCPFVLKPAERTPLGALAIGEILSETDLPPGAFSVLPCHVEDADPFTTDPRLRLLSFTGSRRVGWMLRDRAGPKKVVLELGGNAACVVDEGVDVEDVVDRLVFGAYYQSGQSCISVQRVLVHRSVYGELVPRLVEQVRGLRMGDPRDEETFIGPLIAEAEAERLVEWVREAEAGGARILTGGGRKGAMMEPTVVEDPPRESQLYREEAFGPVLTLHAFDDFDDALDRVNDSRYGLQAGVFTREVGRMMRAWERLEVGGVVINDVPSFRVDNMPYGGVKDSGLGREGVRFAMEEMSERRLLVIRDPTPRDDG